MIRKKSRREESLDHAELARLLPAPGDPHLSLDRHLLLEEHLMNEIQRTAPAPAPAPAPARRPARRLLLIGVPVTAAALAGAFAFTALTGSGGVDPAVATPPPVEAPVVRIEPGSTAQLASTVEHIAAAASARKTPEPGPGQYVYVKSEVSFLSVSHTDTDKSKAWVQPLHIREVWNSPDGKQGWLDEPGYKPKGGITLDSDVEPSLGAPSYDYLKTLPTDPDVLLEKIYKETKGQGNSPDQQAFTTVGDLLIEELVPAKLNAALYRAAAKIPGVVVVDHAKDAAGREGIALAHVDQKSGDRTEWIFDPKTYAYLGSRAVQVKQADGVKPGTVIESTAVLERAVVDAQKQRPGAQGTGA
ncbi:CU044_5270 family protein [Streptomyces sp. NBC_01340]|uniref:CU044_5270 family protein n=1 Tax=unclassified Streptomyces TaxID=2593676 RepID=UPI00224E0B45|nr:MULTISPECIES: CU044_5270 family protein [unclassified Streptomyces]MCX4455181.1 CU044_5270 family protein [Streptomyces sp. NBC_01719]MCX4494541.1 CU044_5270 family protein [Streptomyces sp. NBC_01728]MCX4590934.1 CU044_5270 family protein [Streptomyces sp. NBC_01549]WSI39594.1 CU044_5270 family protein [Streptomyces sp. NBC_01340]